MIDAGYRVMLYEASSAGEAMACTKRATARQAASLLVYAGHGSQSSVRFGHDARDAFGRGLAGALRKEGFAIRSTPADGELVVRYVVETIKGTERLRVAIYVRGRTLARAYAQRADGVYPVGPWSYGGPDGS